MPVPNKRSFAPNKRHSAPAPEIRRVETCNEVTGFQPSKKSVARLFGLLDAYPARTIPPGDLSIAFLDDDAISALHEKYLDDPAPTDVITFPGETATTGATSANQPPLFAGESCICVPQARREAVNHANTVQEEILLYLVHGWLHLSGLDDHADEDRALMRSAEKDVLRWLHAQHFKPAWGA
jgi:probable rRNA maturation factor